MSANDITDLQADAGWERLVAKLFPATCAWEIAVQRNNPLSYSHLSIIDDNNPDEELPGEQL